MMADHVGSTINSTPSPVSLWSFRNRKRTVWLPGFLDAAHQKCDIR